MNPGRTTDHAIAEWLASEAPFELDELVLEATFVQTRRTRQRGLRGAWRPFSMTRFMAIAAGAVAIVVAVSGALILLRPRQDGIAAPSLPAPSVALPSASANPSAAAVASVNRPPLGLAIVNLDGTLRRDLGLPRDAWMATLSRDGSNVAFLTKSPQLGNCGGCVPNTERLAIVTLGAQRGVFLYPSGDPAVTSIAQPAWSPDGTELAFEAKDDNGNVDLYVVHLDLSAGQVAQGVVRRLTTDPAIDEFPAWSPDGKTIVYDNMGATGSDGSGFSSTQEIWSVPAAGGKPVRLTNNGEPDSQPDVAANGTIVFWRSNGIWTMSLTGSRQSPQRQIQGDQGFNPRWSPDGRRIVMHVYDHTDRTLFDPSLGLATRNDLPLLKVFVVDIATGASTEVGPRVVADFNPASWLPDGAGLFVNRYDDPR
jgi:hypothetical protein